MLIKYFMKLLFVSKGEMFSFQLDWICIIYETLKFFNKQIHETPVDISVDSE